MVKTKAELAALPDELHFDKDGKIIEDANYKKPISATTITTDALARGALRIYVPGYNDAMINTAAVMQAATCSTNIRSSRFTTFGFAVLRAKRAKAIFAA